MSNQSNFDPSTLPPDKFKMFVEVLRDTSKFSLDFAILTVRSTILVNGAGVLAILTFIGNLWAKDKDNAEARAVASAMVPAIGFFLLGTCLGVVVAFLGYLSLRYAAEDARQPDGSASRRTQRYRTFAISALVAALASFAAGSIVSIRGFVL